MTYEVFSTGGRYRNPAVFATLGIVTAIVGGATSGMDQLFALGISVIAFVSAIGLYASTMYEIRFVEPTIEFRRPRGSKKIAAGTISEIERCFLPGDEDGRATWMVYVKHADSVVELNDSAGVRNFTRDLQAAYPTVRLTGEWPGPTR